MKLTHRAGIAVALVATAMLLASTLRIERAPEPRWRAPLSEREGGPVVAWVACTPDRRDERRIEPARVALTLTGAGEARMEAPAFREWLREKAAVLQLVCMTGELKGWLRWDVPTAEADEFEGSV